MEVLLLSAYWQCRWSHSGRRSKGSAIFPAEEPRLDFSEHKWCYAPIADRGFHTASTRCCRSRCGTRPRKADSRLQPALTHRPDRKPKGTGDSACQKLQPCARFIPSALHLPDKRQSPEWPLILCCRCQGVACHALRRSRVTLASRYKGQRSKISILVGRENEILILSIAFD